MGSVVLLIVAPTVHIAIFIAAARVRLAVPDADCVGVIHVALWASIDVVGEVV